MKKGLKKTLFSLISDGRIVCSECGAHVEALHGTRPTLRGWRKHVMMHGMNEQSSFLRHVDPAGDVCLCGCSEKTMWNRQLATFGGYVHGHNSRGKTLENDVGVRVRSEKMKEHFRTGRMVTSFKQMSPERLAQVHFSRSTTMKRLTAEGVNILPNMRLSAEERSRSQQRAYQTLLERGKEPGGFKRMKRGWYESQKGPSRARHHSGWELSYMRQLDADVSVLSWTRPVQHVSYVDPSSGRTRRYYPDFTVTRNDGTTAMVEIKGELKETDVAKIAAGSTAAYDLGMEFVVLTSDDHGMTFRKMLEMNVESAQ